MKIGDCFPSKYLKASDICGKRYTVQIDGVQAEKIKVDQGEEIKPVVYFIGREKGIVLNRTNSMILESAFGAETDFWHGKSIVLTTHKVMLRGDMVDGFTFELMPENPQEQPAPPAQSDAAPADEVPF